MNNLNIGQNRFLQRKEFYTKFAQINSLKLSKTELIKLLKQYTELNNITYSHELFFTLNALHREVMQLICNDIHETVSRVFGSIAVFYYTHGVRLRIDPRDIALDIKASVVGGEYSEIDVDQGLAKNCKLLAELGNNIKKFIDIVEIKKTYYAVTTENTRSIASLFQNKTLANEYVQSQQAIKRAEPVRHIEPIDLTDFELQQMRYAVEIEF